MSIITESELLKQRRSSKTFSMTLNESLRSFRNESAYLKTKIFLSHEHNEKEYLEGAISLLKTYGVDVYVDWLDDSMPKTTSGETAAKIKKKIKENDKFIFLGTDGAISSKWCNWELGLGDAAKYMDNIALLPIKKDFQSFSGSEYLDIYPHIEYRDGSSKYNSGYYIPKGHYVSYPSISNSHTIISLREWLTR